MTSGGPGAIPQAPSPPQPQALVAALKFGGGLAELGSRAVNTKLEGA